VLSDRMQASRGSVEVKANFQIEAQPRFCICHDKVAVLTIASSPYPKHFQQSNSPVGSYRLFTFRKRS
jgi:hypothetical protein